MGPSTSSVSTLVSTESISCRPGLYRELWGSGNAVRCANSVGPLMSSTTAGTGGALLLRPAAGRTR